MTTIFYCPVVEAKNGRLRVAVASNFAPAMRALVKNFETKTGEKVILSIASTGKHYAQIMHGAPFDIFFSADKKRPKLLEQNGKGLKNTRFTYALGKLVLWSLVAQSKKQLMMKLNTGDFNYLAIANPKLAPYGVAAKQFLMKQKIWVKNQSKIVRGENIAQAFQFVKSGNAEIGVVAYSQLQHTHLLSKGTMIKVPQSTYETIEQQVILLKSTPSAEQFLNYVKSAQAQTNIKSFGYGLP